MDELIAELRKLGATVERDTFGYVSVNGQRITVEAKRQGNKDDGKLRYEIGIGGKRCASARNAAYYVLTEYLPDLKRKAEMRAAFEVARADLPDDVRVRMMHDGEVRIMCRDAEQLKQTLKHLVERMQ